MPAAVSAEGQHSAISPLNPLSRSLHYRWPAAPEFLVGPNTNEPNTNPSSYPQNQQQKVSNPSPPPKSQSQLPATLQVGKISRYDDIIILLYSSWTPSQWSRASRAPCRRREASSRGALWMGPKPKFKHVRPLEKLPSRGGDSTHTQSSSYLYSLLITNTNMGLVYSAICDIYKTHPSVLSGCPDGRLHARPSRASLRHYSPSRRDSRDRQVENPVYYSQIRNPENVSAAPVMAIQAIFHAVITGTLYTQDNPVRREQARRNPGNIQQ